MRTVWINYYVGERMWGWKRQIYSAAFRIRVPYFDIVFQVKLFTECSVLMFMFCCMYQLSYAHTVVYSWCLCFDFVFQVNSSLAVIYSVYILFQRNGMIGLTSAGGGGSGPPGGGVRERTRWAADYYNNTVLRARVGAGLTGPRTGTSSSSYSIAQDALHRSNSSLELTHDPHHGPGTADPPVQLRREYGSHGSIDVISATSERGGTSSSSGAGESFFAMLQDYQIGRAHVW
jgi:hypothetical protein